MKTSLLARCIFFFIFLVGNNSSFAQTISTDSKNFKEDVLSKKEGLFIRNPIKKSKYLTHNEIYSEGETIRAFYAKVASDASTKTKSWDEKSNDNEVTIKLYYQQNRLYTIVYRVFNSKKEKILNRIFDFDEQNSCISNTERNINYPISYTNTMYWDSLVRFDADYNRIEINPEQKQQIIQSTKLSLDSLMTHFPEFKYSLNWK